MNLKVSKRPLFIFLGLSAMILTLHSDSAFSAGGYTVQCKSTDHKKNICNIDTRNQLKADLVKQTSQSQCQKNSSWGETPMGVWVDNGCSGVFNLSDSGLGQLRVGPHNEVHGNRETVYEQR